MNPSEEMLDQVSDALLMWAEALANPRPVTAPLVRIWALVLEEAGIAPEEVEAISARLLLTQRYFPTPLDFLNAAHPPEARELVEELAWQRVLRAVRRFGWGASLCAADLEGDSQALWAAARLGWVRLCTELDDGNRLFWRKEFVRVYWVGRELGEGLEYLPGPMELENRGRNVTLTPALAGRPDWKAWPAPRPCLPER